MTLGVVFQFIAKIYLSCSGWIDGTWRKDVCLEIIMVNSHKATISGLLLYFYTEKYVFSYPLKLGISAVIPLKSDFKSHLVVLLNVNPIFFLTNNISDIENKTFMIRNTLELI